MRLAVCTDGSIAFDSADVTTSGAMPGGGVDLGSTTTRRGTWHIVLKGGKPVIQAQWQGTGTSYSLTGYFDIVVGDGWKFRRCQRPSASSCRELLIVQDSNSDIPGFPQ